MASTNTKSIVDTHRRSLVKSLSWRITATVITTLISWYITGTWAMALSIGSIEFLSKLLLYYGHERLWELIAFGKKTYDYQI
ncbi:MAG: DUF2061 domain-containing protein [Candidatus Marinamargulisbacteria bacterium]|nr:hypothetical protein [bacterium]MDG2265016.1 DUF2061 domain-containing protein [Candidatus Marinamargulisbacteria bacterium]